MILATMKQSVRHLQESEQHFTTEYDAIIVGGGTAAVITALSLAEQEYKILLIEPLSKLGGTLTHSVFGYYFGAAGGYYEEIDKKVKLLEQQPYLIAATESYLFNPLARAYVYEQELRKAAVDIVFHARIEGVFLQQESVVGIRYWHEGKLVTAGCRFLVDGTAEAYAAELAGAKVEHGRMFDQATQPFSQTATYFDYDKLTITVNNIDSGYIKQHDKTDYAEKIITANQGKQLLKENYNDGSAMLFLSPLLGLREGSCIVGIEQLKFEDMIYGKETEKPLFYTYSHVDNHGKDIAFESQAQNDWMTAMNLWSISFSAGISLGMLLPQGVSNCIVAGRHFSRDHDMRAHSRMNRDMQKLGEAAAAVILEADRQQCNLAAVDYQAVQTRLQQTNCLNEANHVGTTDIFSNTIRELKTPYPRTVDEIKNLLCTEKPGLGILAAIRLQLDKELRQWFLEEDEELQFNSAAALALLDCEDGAEILLKTAVSHSGKRFKTSRKYNMPRGVTAIYLLGRLGYLPALPGLLALLRNHEVLKQDTVVFDDLIANMEDYRFQYISHLLRALAHIVQKHPAVKAEVANVIWQVLESSSFTLKISLKVSGTAEKNQFDMTARVKEYAACCFGL